MTMPAVPHEMMSTLSTAYPDHQAQAQAQEEEREREREQAPDLAAAGYCCYTLDLKYGITLSEITALERYYLRNARCVVYGIRLPGAPAHNINLDPVMLIVECCAQDQALLQELARSMPNVVTGVRVSSIQEVIEAELWQGAPHDVDINDMDTMDINAFIADDWSGGEATSSSSTFTSPLVSGYPMSPPPLDLNVDVLDPSDHDTHNNTPRSHLAQQPPPAPISSLGHNPHKASGGLMLCQPISFLGV